MANIQAWRILRGMLACVQAGPERRGPDNAVLRNMFKVFVSVGWEQIHGVHFCAHLKEAV